MQKLILLLFLILSNWSFSQDCYPDPYHKSGGLYPFCTFLESSSPYAPLEGVCSNYQNGKIVAYHEFRNGIIQIQRYYDAETGKLTSEFKRVNKDSTIAEYFSKPDGIHLEQKKTYYINKEAKRCWKEENYREGKLYQVLYYRNFTADELAKEHNTSPSDYEADSEGYTTEYSLFGKESEYYPSGKIHFIKEHKLTVSPYSWENTQHGNYVEYYENGVELEHGTYANGQKNGEFVYHHMNGQISARKTFTNDIQTGKGKEYYENGKLLSTIEFGDQYDHELESEKRYYPSGKLQFESTFKRDTLGYETEYYENGVKKEYRLYRYYNKDSKEMDVSYFPNGKMKSRWYYRPSNDTASVEYFADGTLKSVRLRFKDDQREEHREYYSNHQLAIEEYRDSKDSASNHTFTQYSENGNRKLAWETHGKLGRFYTTKEFWGNGNLKVEKQFDQHILNGYWIEQDSLGRVLKKCHYTNGFRDSLCEVTPKLKLAPLTAEQEKCLLSLVVHQITQRRHETNTIIDEKQINEEVNVLRKVEQFLISTYFSKFQFNCDQHKLTTFHYNLYMPNAEYSKYKTQIDSVINILKWDTIQPSCLCGVHFNSTKLYSPLALDSIFKSVIPNASKYFYLGHVITTCLLTTGNNYFIQPTVSLERKELEKAWLADVYGNKVVVYDDGMVECYNGSTFRIEEPAKPLATVGAMEWKLVKNTVKKGKK